MTSLLCDISIWSLREDDRGLLVRDTDFSCFKYYDKNQQKSQAERPYAQVGSSFLKSFANIEKSNIKSFNVIDVTIKLFY